LRKIFVPVKKRKKKKKQREAGATVRPCWAGVRAGNAITNFSET
jgi:hypothetical protein